MPRDASLDIRTFRSELAAAVEGELHFDDVRRAVYATDASNYEIRPLGVFTPRHDDDVRAAVRIAARHGVSIVPRGGGTSLAGQAIGPGLVIDFSRHMNAIVELDVAGRRVRVQPGLVRDELNARIAEHGLFFSPETATSTRANIGGMIANNSSGTRSLRYGKTIDHVLELRVLLADGNELTLAPRDRETMKSGAGLGAREAGICRGVMETLESEREEIVARFPKVMRRVGGYPLDVLLDAEQPNLASLLVGSEGTLALTLEATLDLDEIPRATGLAIVHFDASLDAIRAVPAILAHDPSAVELLDDFVVRQAKAHPTIAKLCGFVEDAPGAILMVEMIDEDERTIAERMARFDESMGEQSIGRRTAVVPDPGDQSRVWSVRKNGLGLLLSVKGDRKPMPFIEDAAIPVDRLAEYIERVLALCRRLGVDVVLYAHASVGVLHVRPVLSLKEHADVERMKVIADEVLALVMSFGGALSGEHGDGRVRSPFLERFYGTRIHGAFRRIKHLFDPEALLNPGVIIDPDPIDANLRYGKDYVTASPVTVYKYREDGTFAAAVEMCNGVGACRSTLTGTMCPSYRASRDEVHTTRGRANALRLAMSGRLGRDVLTGEGVHDALHLCLSCKACKSECPSRVDMAKLKGEVMQMRHDAHGSSLCSRLIADFPEHAGRLSGRVGGLVSALAGSTPVRYVLEAALGIDHRRRLPAISTVPLDVWFARRGIGHLSNRRVGLFADTYITHHEPHIGRAATHLLESMGYQVDLVLAGCCQRPRISQGFLREARSRGEATLRALEPFVAAGRPILVVEPSCASALVDDLADLVEDRSLINRVVPGIKLLEDFLAGEMREGRMDRTLVSSSESAVVHGHCHQRAVFGLEGLMSVLSRVEGLSVRELDTGCCGMAGAFGYTRDRYALSMAIGEDRLFPAVRGLSPTTDVIANGFSCRHQIGDGTERRARHWVEIVRCVEPE